MYQVGLSLFTVTALALFDVRNENREKIMKQIETHPGLTLYDLKRDLNLNVGTVRYHLLMLTLNHRICSFDDGTKYVRYFKNSNTFSGDEKLVISMLRRSHVKEILQVMMDNPGIPNMEVAVSLGLQESAVSRCMRMLAVRGVVVRTSANGEKAAYKIADSYLDVLLSTIGIVRMRTLLAGTDNLADAGQKPGKMKSERCS